MLRSSAGRGAIEDARREPITREQLLVTAAVMAGIAVAALNTTIVATAMPTIVGQLGSVVSSATGGCSRATCSRGL